MEPVIISIIVIAAGLAIVSFTLSKAVYIVQQAEGFVMERFGRFQKVLTSGLNVVVPFVDIPRPFTWRRTYIDSTGIMRSEDTIQNRIDMRESVFNFPIQEVYTRDTILLDVNSIMYYRITDVKKAVYEVEDLNTAISNVAQTQLKEVFGNMTFTEALASQSKINKHMKEAFGERFAAWGVQVERMELLDMVPKADTTISNAMKRQMIAERNRRAEFVIAEGEKSATRLVSEGTKLEKYNTGVAEQEASRKESEGLAAARIELARAESKSLELLNAAFRADGSSRTDFLISQRYIDLLDVMNDAVDAKTVYIPYQSASLTGLISGLHGTYGRTGSKRDSETEEKKTQPSEYEDLN